MKEKIKQIKDKGIAPLLIGVKNFITADEKTIELAKKRAAVCVACPSITNEPNEIFWKNDKEIPSLSKKMCGDCFCVLSIKTRQSKDICKKWNNLL